MSQVQDPDIYFDVDRDIIGPLRSPPLEPVQPVFESQDTPPPLVRVESSSESSSAEDTSASGRSRKPKRRRRKGRTHSTLADGVLIRSLDPNQSALASLAERSPLESASQSEAEEEENEAVSRAGGKHMRGPSDTRQNEAKQVPTHQQRTANVVAHNLDEDDDWRMIDIPPSVNEEKAIRSRPNTSDRTRKHSSPRQPRASVALRREDLSKKHVDALPPLKSRPMNKNLRLKLASNSDRREHEDDSIIKSPILGKFAISPRDAHPDFILPAMLHRSPLQSPPAGSPGHKLTLPSLKTAIGHIHDANLARFTSMSPMMGRPSPIQLAQYASPVSYSAYPGMSPPSLPPQYAWRPTTRDSSTWTSSDYTSSTSASISTPASSMIIPSPAATNPSPLPALLEYDKDEPPVQQTSSLRTRPEYENDALMPRQASPSPATFERGKDLLVAERASPPPTLPEPDSDARAIQQVSPLPASPEHQKGDPVTQLDPDMENDQKPPSDESSPLSELASSPEPLSEPEPDRRPKSQPEVPIPTVVTSTRLPSGEYVCLHEGCNAQPFLTLYLLNSHMNVHSEARTHFCPVAGCPRGPGGKGFKRKNEMIRHGLVHESPGYICPYCPDQQHKYPRPDNLQRHVRHHHADKDPHDSVLRDVLDQRTDGATQKGRRRMRL